jgi:hypothetical protein
LYQIKERKESNPRIGVKDMKTSRIIETGRSLRRSGAGFVSIVFCLLSLNGCVTTESSLMSPEPDGTYKKVNISRIVLRNGDKIDCSDKIVFFEESPKDSTGMFAITEKYNLGAGGEGVSGFTDKTQYVPLSDVLLVYRDVEKVDGVKTTFAVLGTIAGTAAGVLIIAFTLGVGGFANP